MGARRLAPDTASAADGPAPECGAWQHDPPWPAIPDGIHFAERSYSPSTLLQAPEARATPLPHQLANAHPKRRADYVAGRLCAAAALCRMGRAAVVIGRQPNGAPCWPAGATGSIAHSDGRAVAIAASAQRYGSLGIDVERIVSDSQAHTLAPLILTSDERDRFSGHATAAKLTVVFSLKEALFKALHPLTQTMFFHEDAEVLSLQPDGLATLRLLTQLSPDWPSGKIIEAHWQCRSTAVFSLVAVRLAEREKGSAGS